MDADEQPKKRKKLPARRVVKDKRVDQTGYRRRFIEAMDEIYLTYPRPNLARRAADWYTDGHLINGRPLYAILTLSNYAECLLHKARYGRHRDRGFREAVAFFAATRRAMFWSLRNTKAAVRIPLKTVRALRTRVASLIEYAKIAREAVDNQPSTVV